MQRIGRCQLNNDVREGGWAQGLAHETCFSGTISVLSNYIGSILVISDHLECRYSSKGWNGLWNVRSDIGPLSSPFQMFSYQQLQSLKTYLVKQAERAREIVLLKMDYESVIYSARVVCSTALHQTFDIVMLCNKCILVRTQFTCSCTLMDFPLDLVTKLITTADQLISVGVVDKYHCSPQA